MHSPQTPIKLTGIIIRYRRLVLIRESLWLLSRNGIITYPSGIATIVCTIAITVAEPITWCESDGRVVAK